jgi:hypothetical protein
MEDLAQTPYAISSLEVVQSLPSKRKAFLFALGEVENTN